MKSLCCFYVLLLNFQSFHVLVKAYTPIPRSLHSAILIGNKFYILGGDTSPTSVSGGGPLFSPSKDFYYLDVSAAFNTTNIQWIDLSNNAGIPKQSRAAVSAGGPNKDVIFLFGGAFENSSYGIPLVYAFDTVKKVWNTPTIQGIQPPRRQYLHSVTEVTGKMYIFGGSYNIMTGNSSDGYVNQLDILDTIGLAWLKGSQLQAPSPRDGYSVTLLPNGILAYIGGYTVSGPTNLKEVYLYDTKNDVWETMITVGTIPNARAHHTSVLGLNNDRLIVYGGFYNLISQSVVHDLSVLDIRNKPYRWFIPKISGITPQTPSNHAANVVGRYMIMTYGFLLSQAYVNPDMYILDIGDDSEYKWVTSFDPNSSPVSSPNSSSNQNGYKIDIGIMIGAIIGTFIGSILLTVSILMIYRRYKKRKYAHAIPTQGN